MKIEIFKCPECGQPAAGVLENVYCLAQIQEPDADGLTDYEGYTEVLWDSQTAVDDPGGYSVECCNGHRWITPIDWRYDPTPTCIYCESTAASWHGDPSGYREYSCESCWQQHGCKPLSPSKNESDP